MQIVKFSFKYGHKFTPEDQERLSSLFGSEIRFDESGECWSNVTATMELALSLGYLIRDIEVVQIPGLPKDTLDAKVLNMVKLALGSNFNHVTNVHVPGDALMKINTVLLEEDCCTDKVNDLLQQGWRILAICPQPQRRPDYIFGVTRVEQ